MSEQSMKELLEQEDMPDIQERTVVKGVVVQVSRDEAYVDIGYKQEIPVSKRDLAVPAPDDARDVVKVGDVIDVYIKELRKKLDLDCILTVRNVGYKLERK